MKKLLFVCMGNICRSPAAEIVMKTIIREAGLESQFQCDSCGTVAYHQGEKPDSRMVGAGKRKGFIISGSSRPIINKDFDEFDYIFTMDDENYSNVLKLTSNSKQRNKVKKFCTFMTHHDESEIPDPYYGGVQGFDNVIDLLHDGCNEILKQLPNIK